MLLAGELLPETEGSKLWSRSYISQKEHPFIMLSFGATLMSGYMAATRGWYIELPKQ